MAVDRYTLEEAMPMIAAEVLQNAQDESDYFKAEMLRARGVAEALWQLLDNIDTLQDVCKSDDVAFRRLVQRHHEKRHEYLTSDGYRLYWPPDKPPEKSTCPEVSNKASDNAS
jgi:hypothetical protein